MDAFLKLAKQAAFEGGAVLEKYWGKLTQIREKNFRWDLVTEADKESEEVIIKLIKNSFPHHGILSEEAGLISDNQSEYLWVVDPLDGTTNYTHQYPWVCISIALLHFGQPIIGVIYNPIHSELFEAKKNDGAYLNQEPISVSSVKNLEKSLLATGFAYDRRETQDNNYKEFCHITHCSQGVRRGGSAALDLAYVASGRLDGFWERGLKPWDIAAGTLIVQEAGGKVTSYEGDTVKFDSGRILATNDLIHTALIHELGQCV